MNMMTDKIRALKEENTLERSIEKGGMSLLRPGHEQVTPIRLREARAHAPSSDLVNDVHI